MNLRITGTRLGGALKTTEVTKKTAVKSSPLGKAAQDRLELSDMVKRMAEQMTKMGQEEKDENASTSMLDSYKKQLDIMNKCAKISASISAGDRVPPEDLRYLKEHDMNAYRLAMATRKPKHDPKDKDSVLSEEDVKELESGSEVSMPASAPADVE